MTVDQLTLFFGWFLLINVVLFGAASLGLLIFRKPVMAIHSKIMDVEEAKLPIMYFKYLANYKIAILVFALAPYLALRIAF